MSDITPERLAELRGIAPPTNPIGDIIHGLLDEIDRLRARLTRIAAILEPLRALEAKAVPGPWVPCGIVQATTRSGKPVPCKDQYGLRAHYRVPATDSESATAPIDFGGALTEQDAEVICAARNALPLLLAEIEETKP